MVYIDDAQGVDRCLAWTEGLYVPPTPNLLALGIAIRVYRAQLQISQEELAYRAGMHRTYLSGVERGERNPSFRSVVAIAYALGI